MRNFLQMLRNNHVFRSHIYYNELGEIKDKKTQKKFNNALNSYVKLVPDEAPLVLFDSTFFGSAKDGFTLTNKGIHIHSGDSSEKHAPFISYKYLQVSQNEKDLMINSSKFSMIPLSANDVARVVEVINLCKKQFTEPNMSEGFQKRVVSKSDVPPQIREKIKHIEAEQSYWERLLTNSPDASFDELARQIHKDLSKASKASHIWSREHYRFDSKLKETKGFADVCKCKMPRDSEVVLMVSCDEHFKTIVFTDKAVFFVPSRSKNLNNYAYDKIKTFEFESKEGILTYYNFIKINGEVVMDIDYGKELFNIIENIVETFKQKRQKNF